ncbi:unnamed protein product [Echinostoma caproni]|uniref:Uncharacterized protein n=1 Tax=Echinostoma caproni TaxID=27848 RepID=A0A3P8ELB1_9TREM|nr:unnamed protein product [Echinostoma caproni]
MAADAATTLSQLVSSANSHGPNISNISPSPSSPYCIVPPCAWPYTPNTAISSSDTLFGSDALQKSLSLHPNSLGVSVTDSSSLDEIWNRHWNCLSEPWLAAAQQSIATFSVNSKDTGSSPDKIRLVSYVHRVQFEIASA